MQKVTQLIQGQLNNLERKLNPSVPYYIFYLPNADTVISILPFLLFGILVLTAFFSTYISYQRVLFLPDINPQKPFSWSGAL